MSNEEYSGLVFPRIDFAGDHTHPGPLSNKLLALAAVAKMATTSFQRRGRRVRRIFRSLENNLTLGDDVTSWVARRQETIVVEPYR